MTDNIRYLDQYRLAKRTAQIDFEVLGAAFGYRPPIDALIEHEQELLESIEFINTILEEK